MKASLKGAIGIKIIYHIIISFDIMQDSLFNFYITMLLLPFTMKYLLRKKN